MTNNSINFGLQSKPNIIIDMQNRNNFKLGLGNYLEIKLKLITCCNAIIKYETKINIFPLLYMKERRIECKKKRKREIDKENKSNSFYLG